MLLFKRGWVFSPEMKKADEGSAHIAHTVLTEPEGKGERNHEPQLFFWQAIGIRSDRIIVLCLES